MKMKQGQKAVLYSRWKQYTGANCDTMDSQPTEMCVVNMMRGGGVITIMGYMPDTCYYIVEYRTYDSRYTGGYLHESTLRAIKNHKKRKGKKKK